MLPHALDDQAHLSYICGHTLNPCKAHHSHVPGPGGYRVHSHCKWHSRPWHSPPAGCPLLAQPCLMQDVLLRGDPALEWLASTAKAAPSCALSPQSPILKLGSASGRFCCRLPIASAAASLSLLLPPPYHAWPFPWLHCLCLPWCPVSPDPGHAVPSSSAGRSAALQGDGASMLRHRESRPLQAAHCHAAHA